MAEKGSTLLQRNSLPLHSLLWVLSLSWILPYMYCGRWPTDNDTLADSMKFMIYASLLFLAFAIGIVQPFIVNALLSKANGKLFLFSSDQQKVNTKRITEPLFKQAFVVGVVTTIQGILIICWGIYVGQISLKFFETEYIADLLQTDNKALIWGAYALRFVAQVWSMLFLADISNYGFHRLGHENKFLWKTLHYMHHEIIYPNHGFWASYYSSIIEMVWSNFCYMCAMFLFPGSDLVTVLSFGVMSQSYAVSGHSGLDFEHHPILNFIWHPTFHTYHHLRFNVNYCEHFTLVDKFFGTYYDGDINKYKRNVTDGPTKNSARGVPEAKADDSQAKIVDVQAKNSVRALPEVIAAPVRRRQAM